MSKENILNLLVVECVDEVFREKEIKSDASKISGIEIEKHKVIEELDFYIDFKPNIISFIKHKINEVIAKKL